MHKPLILATAAALLRLGSARATLADDANGDRPGLNQPPGLSERTVGTVPEPGSSALLLGTALVGLAILPVAGRMIRRGASAQ